MTQNLTKTLTLLAASTALTAALGLPAWSAMHSPAQTGAASSISSLIAGDEATAKLILVEGDEEDDDDDEGGRKNRRSDDDDDDEDECDDDDDDGCGTAAAAPAPAGSIAPPQNGLFGTGTPQVKVK